MNKGICEVQVVWKKYYIQYWIYLMDKILAGPFTENSFFPHKHAVNTNILLKQICGYLALCTCLHKSLPELL